MFERYTEKARRVIFFARYEASVFGSPCIETEHLLLGLLREDKALANKFTLPAEAIRKQIEQHTTVREKTSTSVDLPLSHECKRVLAFAAEEAERLNHKHIHTDHLLLGMLREERCFAANLLQERRLRLMEVREEIARSNAKLQGSSAPPEDMLLADAASWLWDFLTARQKQGGITVAARPTVGSHNPDFAVWAGLIANHDGETLERADQEGPLTPQTEIALIKVRIRFLIDRLENAIANHEFEKAKSYSEEERKERENLRLKLEQHQIQDEEPASPLLCIEFVRKESLSDLQTHVDSYLTAGVEQVWLLDPANKKAYTTTLADGLREFKGQILQAKSLELPLNELFS